MKVSPERITVDSENYRIAHGQFALYPYYGRSTGKLYVVKSQNEEEVVLTEVYGDKELQVSASEFASAFGMWMQDESVYFFGSKNQQATARAQWDRVSATIKRVLYARQLPVVINAAPEVLHTPLALGRTPGKSNTDSPAKLLQGAYGWKVGSFKNEWALKLLRSGSKSQLPRGFMPKTRA